jgi:hypothetical protein
VQIQELEKSIGGGGMKSPSTSSSGTQSTSQLSTSQGLHSHISQHNSHTGATKKGTGTGTSYATERRVLNRKLSVSRSAQHIDFEAPTSQSQATTSQSSHTLAISASGSSGSSAGQTTGSSTNTVQSEASRKSLTQSKSDNVKLEKEREKADKEKAKADKEKEKEKRRDGQDKRKAVKPQGPESEKEKEKKQSLLSRLLKGRAQQVCLFHHSERIRFCKILISVPCFFRYLLYVYYIFSGCN